MEGWMSEQPKSLAAKMAAILGEVPTMVHDGQNVAQRYGFTTAEQVKAALRPLLKKHKVALFANMLDVERETSLNKNGNPMVTVIAKMCFTLVCGDTGERMDCIWYGEANDYADKACNKAATAATKYFLTNTFLLSTTEPESDEVTIETPVAENGRYAVEPAGRINKTQMAAIRQLSKGLWGDEYKDEGTMYVARVYGCALTELSDHEADRMIADLQRKVAEKDKQPA
jgi:hypothetical protein